jgi:hypothetical protein
MAKRPRDPNQLAKLVVDIAIGQAGDEISEEKKHPTVKRGQIAGMKGGPARAAKLTPTQRKGIAICAAKARWGRPKKKT